MKAKILYFLGHLFLCASVSTLCGWLFTNHAQEPVRFNCWSAFIVASLWIGAAFLWDGRVTVTRESGENNG